MQTVQRIFNFTDIQVLYIFLEKIWKLDVIIRLLITHCYTLSTLKNSPIFWTNLYNAAFLPLIQHRFLPFLKQQTSISVWMRTPVKFFSYLCAGGLLGGINRGRFVRSVLLKWHIFR